MKKWVNVELDKESANGFKIYLKNAGIKFETSGAGHLTHFECLMDNKEIEEADKVLEGC